MFLSETSKTEGQKVFETGQKNTQLSGRAGKEAISRFVMPYSRSVAAINTTRAVVWFDQARETGQKSPQGQELFASAANFSSHLWLHSIVFTSRFAAPAACAERLGSEKSSFEKESIE